MSRKVRLSATSIGGDLTTVDIYQISASVEYLLTSSIDATQLLGSGLQFIISESANTIVVRGNQNPCFNVTSSVAVSYPQTIRYFDVFSDGDGTVQINTPVPAGPTTTVVSQSVDFAVYSTFVIEGTATYPTTFQGWYNGPSGSGAGLLSTNNPLTVTQTTFTGSDAFYGYFG